MTFLLQVKKFSLHGEKGKNKKRPYGLTPSQSKRWFSKKRDKSSMGKARVDEYSESKIDVAIKKGVRFDYLLVDSWFTCFALVKFITTRRIGYHFLGMIKMGKTRYNVFDKELTAKEIVDMLRRRKKVKRSKLTGHYYAELTVDFKGIPVKLYFSKSSKILFSIYKLFPTVIAAELILVLTLKVSTINL